MGRRRGFAAVGGQHVAEKEHLLAARHRVGAQVLAPCCGHRSAEGDRAGTEVASHRHWNAAGDPSGSRATRNADGIVSHQDCITVTAPAGSCARAMAVIRASSAGRAGSTAYRWLAVGKNASRTAGFSMR